MSPVTGRRAFQVCLIFSLVVVPVAAASAQTTPSAPATGQPAPGTGAAAQPLPAEPMPSPPVPVPVIPPSVPSSEGAPPVLTIPSAPVRLLPRSSAGPPYAVFSVDPSLTLIEEYSDNFGLTDTDRQSNFRSIVSPGLRLSINGAFTQGVIAYTPSVVHDSSTDSVSIFHSLLGQVSWEATPRLRFTVADVLTRSDEPDQANRLGLRRERETFVSNTFSLSSEYAIGTIATREYYRWITFLGGGDNDTTTHILGASATVPIGSTNSGTLGYEYLNSQTSDSPLTGHEVRASLSRRLSTLADAGISGSYAFRTSSNDAGASDDFQIWNTALFSRYTTGSLSLSASVGVGGVTADSGASQGPLFISSTTLSYAFARAVVSLSYDRGFSETFSAGENFGVVETEGVSGSLSYPFTPNISGTVMGFYRRSETTGIGAASAEQAADVVKLWGTTGALSVAVRRWLQVDLSYTHTQRLRDVTAGYVENRALLAIAIFF